MLKRLIILISLLLVCSCGTIKYVPIKGDTVVQYRDSIVRVDSVIYTPVEVIKEVIPITDTLTMSTSLAEAKAYIDTTNKLLKGEIHNKKGITNKVEYKEKIVYRDSIVTQEIPVEVYVDKVIRKAPWYNWILWPFAIFGLVSILILALKIYLKFYGKK